MHWIFTQAFLEVVQCREMDSVPTKVGGNPEDHIMGYRISMHPFSRVSLDSQPAASSSPLTLPASHLRYKVSEALPTLCLPSAAY